MEQERQPEKHPLDSSKHYPLWVLCLNNDPSRFNHPDRILQRMDLETLERSIGIAEAKGLMEFTSAKDVFSDFKPLSVSDIQKYIPDEQWYADALHKDSIHGTMHAMRVFFNLNLLGQMMNLSENSMEVLKVTAMVHDLQRIDDRPDLKHPGAGAEWFHNNYYLLEERGIHLSKKQRHAVEMLTAHHMDSDITKVPQEYQTLLQIFQAADGADLYRTANQIWWPSPKYFDKLFLKLVSENTQQTNPELLDTATRLRDVYLHYSANFALRSLHMQTKFEMDAVDAIQLIANDLGLLTVHEGERLNSNELQITSVATLVQEKSPTTMQEFKTAILEALWEAKVAGRGTEMWLVSGKVSGKKDDDEEAQQKAIELNERKLKIITARLQKKYPTRIYFTSAQIMSPRIRKLLTDSMRHLTKTERHATFVQVWKDVVTEAGSQQLLDGVISVKDWEDSTGAKAERAAAENQHLRTAKYRRRTTAPQL